MPFSYTRPWKKLHVSPSRPWSCRRLASFDIWLTWHILIKQMLADLADLAARISSHQLASACISLHYCSHSVHSSSEGRAVYSIPRWLLKVAPAPHLQNTSSQWRQANSSEQAEPKPSVCERLDLCWIYVGKTFHWPRSWSFSHPFPWLMTKSWLNDDSALRLWISQMPGIFERSFWFKLWSFWSFDCYCMLLLYCPAPCRSWAGRSASWVMSEVKVVRLLRRRPWRRRWKSVLRCTGRIHWDVLSRSFIKFLQSGHVLDVFLHAYHVLYICEMTWTWLNLYTYFDCFCPVWMNIDVYRFI